MSSKLAISVALSVMAMAGYVVLGTEARGSVPVPLDPANHLLR
jgi:hypothetical protein